MKLEEELQKLEKNLQDLYEREPFLSSDLEAEEWLLTEGSLLCYYNLIAPSPYSKMCLPKEKRRNSHLQKAEARINKRYTKVITTFAEEREKIAPFVAKINQSYEKYDFYTPEECHISLSYPQETDLIFSFLEDKHPELYSLAGEHYENRWLLDYNDEEELGFNIYDLRQKKSIIFQHEKVPSIKTCFTFLHELAHVYDTQLANKMLSRKDRINYRFFSPYQEVVPYYIGWQFLDYLKEKNKYVDDVNLVKFDFLYTDAGFMELLGATLKQEYHFPKSICFFEDEGEDTISVRDLLAYSYAPLIGNTLARMSKVDPKEEALIWNRFFNLRGIVYDFSMFEELGLTEEMITSCIEKDLEENPLSRQKTLQK